DDLISIGTIGLIKGIDSYSPSKNIKITTYAAKCIENEILMFFRTNNKHTNNISLNESIGLDKDGNDISLMDVIASLDEDLNTIIFNKMNIEALHEYLSVLNNREKDIIIKRYGLYNSDIYTQKELASKLKISRSYVSRIEKRALSKLYKEFYKSNKNKVI
ncbi:MAG TPA: RNA polymerase subunit sigma-70, partial [Firmicutes bacterium]|nr:RNA polymerase subunit sigma-70 [Bacillota bacterium]